LSGTTQVSRYQKGKINLDFTEERDSEWQWNQLDHMPVCTSLQTDNHASTPSLSFLQAGCPSCRPTNSVKALKAKDAQRYSGIYSVLGKSLKMLEFSIENSKEPMKVLELSPSSLAAVLKSSVLTLIPFFLVKRLLAV